MLKLEKLIKPVSEQTLVERLRNRAMIRRQIPNRKSVQEGKPDRIADLLEEAADEIVRLNNYIGEQDEIIARFDGT
jgi:adenylosuccinate lyase